MVNAFYLNIEIIHAQLLREKRWSGNEFQKPPLNSDERKLASKFPGVVEVKKTNRRNKK